MCDRGLKSSMHSRVRRTRRHQAGKRGKESWEESCSEVNVEQVSQSFIVTDLRARGFEM